MGVPKQDHNDVIPRAAVHVVIMSQSLRIVPLSPTAIVPQRAHDGDAGLDLSSDEYIVIRAGQHALVGTGLSMALPAGTVGMVCPRSGIAARFGVTVLNAPGIVDEKYRGEVKVILVNHSEEDFWVRPGERIAQLVITSYLSPAVTVVATLDDTDRGEGGFGSSGTGALDRAGASVADSRSVSAPA